MSLMRELAHNEVFEFDNKDWSKIMDDFKSNRLIEERTHVEFGQMMEKIFREKNITSGKDFTEATGMDRTYYSKFRSKSYTPSMQSLVALCITLDIEIGTVQELLHSMGYHFRKHNKVHYAYYYLLSNFRGSYIEDCNTILKHLGIAEKYYL